MSVNRTSNSHADRDTQSLLKPLLISVLFGAIGAAVNLFAIPYLPHIHLILGNAAYVIIATRLKPAFALLTALLSVTPLMFIWGHPYGFITFGLEALVIAKLRERGWYIFFSDILYWLCIGMPLTALLIYKFLPNSTDYIIFATLKQGFNGVLYSAIAGLLVFFFSAKLRFRDYHQPLTIHSLRSLLTYAILLICACSVIAATQFGSKKIIDSEQDLVLKSLGDSTGSISDVASIFIKQHKKLIALSASLLQQTPEIQQQQLLEDLQHKYTDFATMLVADNQGRLLYSSPAELLAHITDPELRNIKDRHYFREAMTQQQVYVSPVFQGRGFGNEPLVAISAPFYDNEHKNSPVGIVQGTINANIAAKLSLAKFGEQNISIAIVDQDNKVIFASPELDLPPLAEFSYHDVSEPAMPKRLSFKSDGKRYLYDEHALVENWRVFALMDEALIINNIEKQFINIFLVLTVTLIIAALIASSFSHKLTEPLKFILQQIKKYDQRSSSQLAPLYMDTTREITLIYEELMADKQMVQEHQNHLEELVQSRTEALNAANNQLKELAHHDGLTHIFNRHYLNENFSLIQKNQQRVGNTMALVMLDIDYFKKLNDNFGHLVGDQCLITLAQLIKQEFNRETDILVRFGGEEFLLILPGITAQVLAQKLEQLRCDIEKHQFQHIANHLCQHNDQVTFSITVSQGAVIANANFSNEIEPWIKAADEALYQAKEGGRNHVVIDNKLAKPEELVATSR